MGLLRDVALTVLAISFFTFIALFGRLPVFRKTPIGFLYRVLWIHIPKVLVFLDARLLGGRLLRCWDNSGQYLFYENHPLVLIFFLVILAVSEIMFLPKAWSRLETIHRICAPIAIVLPYTFLYKATVTKSSITPENHEQQMQLYPFDRVLFHPGNICHTCRLPKPPRSKHCSICKACVARHDHHCIWLTNCVGQNNLPYFFALLVSVSVLLIYGAYLGHSLLSRSLPRMGYMSWNGYFRVWSIAIAADIRIGGVFLLTLLTAPLSLGLFVYHMYLVWAGMTTNESNKWGDWREDIADGLVFMVKKKEIYAPPRSDGKGGPERKVPWPMESDHALILTDGDPPRTGFLMSAQANSIIQPNDANAPVDLRWKRVRSLQDITNIYDLGFWRNLRDACGFSVSK